MSTIRSTTSGPNQPPRVAGFNEQSYYDPFFASSVDDDEVLQVVSPDPQVPRASLSPALSKVSAVAPASPLNIHYNDQGRSRSPVVSSHEPPTPSQILQDPFGSTAEHGFLSPHPYPSENGYTGSSEHTGSPDYGDVCDDFYLHLGNELGLGPDQDFPGHLNDRVGEHVTNEDDYRDREISDPVSNGTEKSHGTNATRTSLGTATLSSHLMSPILTDSASPDSREGHGSPAADERNLKREAATNTYLNSGENTGIEPPGGLVQQTTPALTRSSRGTGSSKGNSPERLARPDIARAASPVFRISSYSRGDSPARGTGFARAGRKRSRTSSHLSVEKNDPSVDDVEMAGNDYTRDDHEVRRGGSEAGTPFEGPDRAGLDPSARMGISNDEVLNLKDQESNAEAALKRQEVEEWLDQSEAGSEVEGEAALPPKPDEVANFSKRHRAKTTGDSLSHENLEIIKTARRPPPDFHVPGPGVLLDEESGNDDDSSVTDEDDGEASSRPESPPATVEAINQEMQSGPGYSMPNSTDIEASPFYRVKLWQDPFHDSTDPGVKAQPGTSNEAMYRYELRSKELESVSRKGTWGSRRLSDGDLANLLHRLSFGSRPEGEDAEPPHRKSTFLEQAAAKLRPKRNGSILKGKESSPTKPVFRPTSLENTKKESSGSLGLPSSLRRVSSLSKKPKTPHIKTGGAMAAMNSVDALGTGPASASATSTPSTPWSSAKNALKRSRSRSELPKAAGSSTNLTELWTKQGGPPMPALAAPQKQETKPSLAEHSEDPEDDDEDLGDDKGVTIDLSIRADPIIPTMEGFRANVQQLNPRLPLFMVERVSQEQLRRYKKLMEFKIKHAQAINAGKCSSGRHCLTLGGEPTYLQSKSSSKDPQMSHTGFSVTGLAPSDDDKDALAEGVVTPAQFPPGVPMPPVKRLPAEFECSLCFKVKRFHKPSDWSKHVHEDVQPFTCTFVNCAEPKSFKRKADWVRHENERHRQLEWWLCNYSDCNHKCYRKDNFVQHLVREHKLPEPKIKTAKTSKPAVRGPSAQKARKQMEDAAGEFPEEIDQVWRLVEECRHETQKNPKDEACKFCGNICNSWKKLTVHLAKHMEQISMPVLGIVEKKDVTPETIISPIEQRNSHQTAMSPLQTNISQTHSNVPNYAMPSAGLNTQFAPMQSPGAYYTSSVNPSAMTSNYQNNMSATYPPPMPTSATHQSFATPRTNAYGGASFSSYNTPTTTTFMSGDNHSGRRISQSHSPEHLYNNMRTTPTTHSHSAPYAQAGPFLPPTPYQQQQQQQQQLQQSSPQQSPNPQQQYFSNAANPSSYAFASNHRVPSFSHGAPTSAPMPYDNTSNMEYSPVQGNSGTYQQTQGQGSSGMYPSSQGQGGGSMYQSAQGHGGGGMYQQSQAQGFRY